MDIFEQPVLFYLNTVLLLSKWILKNMMGSEAMGLLEGIDSNVQRKERERLPHHCYGLQKSSHLYTTLQYKSFFSGIEPHKIAWVNRANSPRF